MLIHLVADLSGQRGVHLFAQNSAACLCVCDQCDSRLLLGVIASLGGILLSLLRLALVSLGISFSFQSPVRGQSCNFMVVMRVYSLVAALEERIVLVFAAHDLF